MSIDRILIVGCQDENVIKFLNKMGHEVIEKQGFAGSGDEIGTVNFDLIILDGRVDHDTRELVHYFRSQDELADIPIVYILHRPADAIVLKEYDRIEFIETPYSIGKLAGKIATQLRMRKLKGADESTATLSEMNAALRDLNAKFERDLEAAREIQQSLLPKSFPKNERYEIAASYEPLEQVGGDWFYVHETPSGKLAVQIGDVTGHGLQAAFIGSITRMAMRASQKEMPNELLESMNTLMAPQIPDGSFVTMFSYLYDPETAQLDYARAGHLPGFHLVREKNQVEELLGDGFAVGFFDEAEYSAERTTLGVGDCLIILTDGIPEGQSMDGENYGHERLKKAMLAVPETADAADMLAAVIEDFEAFRGERILKDDVTVIALKRLA